MAFDYIISDNLKAVIDILKKKDKKLAKNLQNKMEEVLSRDNNTIDFYKNLRKPLNDYKRVHVGSFVLKFKVVKEKNLIIFSEFEHHDDSY